MEAMEGKSSDDHGRRGLVAAARDESGDTGSFLPQVISATGGTSWRVGTAPPDTPVWIYVEKVPVPSIERGWKLHVSAALPSASEVLDGVLGVLLEKDVPFKVAASMNVLASLNEGEAGLGQIGKFVTVYPNIDEQAVSVAVELHRATEGLRGPPVLSDRPLVPGSLVHYRYGAFAEPVEGEKGDGGRDELAARPVYSPPRDIADPFMRAGASPPDDKGLVAGRYFITSTLHRSARGAVHVGVDMQEISECILKRAWRDARLTPDGVDARDQLREEAERLQAIANEGPWPKVIDLVDDATDLVMVLERVPGLTLAQVVHRLFEDGNPPGAETIAAWAGRLSSTLATLHTQGFVYRDLNPENVMVNRGDDLFLVDFELAQPPGPVADFYIAGTPGFISPGQARGEPARYSHDLYSFGAMLAFMAIGDRPPGGDENLVRMTNELRAREDNEVTEGLLEIAGECLRADESGPDAMATVHARLAAIGRG